MERLASADEVVAATVAREEASKCWEQELVVREKRLKAAEDAVQMERKGLAEVEEVYRKWEEKLDERTQAVEDQEDAA